ncbi:MAG: proton-conducting membrane transporter [Clostridiales bacterium]|nr:proton-conducting membrane transporter [Candidatus Blautia equi]
MNLLILLPIFLPIIAGSYLLICAFRERLAQNGAEKMAEDVQQVHMITIVVLGISVLAALLVAWAGGEKSITLLKLTEGISVYFRVDQLGALFATFMSIIWFAVSIYAFVYMHHEGNEKRFFGFFLVVYGVLIALDFAGNLITLYFFYELMTLTSMPMVLHSGSRESIMGALKYLFYSMCGAYLALFGIFFLYQNTTTLEFAAGGTLSVKPGSEGILLIAVFCMLIGFGAKAGMFPLHAWLPSAHPVAPSPASAVLSAIIVKAGVMAVIRTVYYVVGPDFLRGTWVQTAWMVLTLGTIFMGSLLAYWEPIFKKRLAYSTVSQVSYVLFGLAQLSEVGMTGALLHSVFHAFIKTALFLTAGIFIFKTGNTRVEDFKGYGKKMPKTLWSYTFASLALIGIPPTSGFISKWYLAQGALTADIGVYGYAGPAVLLVSALLTAGYLLPVTVKGFFPGEGYVIEDPKVEEPPMKMWAPLMVIAAITLLLGVFPNPLIRLAGQIAASIF